MDKNTKHVPNHQAVLVNIQLVSDNSPYFGGYLIDPMARPIVPHGYPRGHKLLRCSGVHFDPNPIRNTTPGYLFASKMN